MAFNNARKGSGSTEEMVRTSNGSDSRYQRSLLRRLDETMRSVAVIFIGTNRYLDFLLSYYEQCEELLMPDCKKQYFVFTDGDLEGAPENISIYNIEHKPWPSITLERFHTILEAEEELKSYDWLLFLDADMRVNKKIFSNEILDPEKDFVAVHHPCHYDDYSGTFETNPESKACVSEKQKHTTRVPVGR